MPDLLAHYAVSLLIASRVTSLKRAPLLALAGLLPDADALLRIHRWATHSLVLTGVAAAATLILARRLAREHLPWLAAALGLYALHITLDTFTAPTPLLWPLTSKAYMVSAQLNCIITQHSLSIAPSITTTSTTVDFTRKTALEAPLATTTGMLTTIAVAIMLRAGHPARKRSWGKVIGTGSSPVNGD